MDPNAIPEALQSDSDSYQRDAVQAAMEQKDAIVPLLLDYLRRLLEDPSNCTSPEQDSNFPVYAIYLLGHHRAHQAHPLLVALLRLPGDTLFDLFDEIVDEGFPKALWKTSGGDATEIVRLVEDPAVNAYCRSAAIHALVLGVADHGPSRREVIGILQGLFTGEDPSGNAGIVLNSAAHHLGELWPGESMDLLREAFEDGLVEPFFINMEDIEAYLAEGEAPRLAKLEQQARQALDATPHEDLASWACFNPDPDIRFPPLAKANTRRSDQRVATRKRRQARKKAKKERAKQRRKKKKKKR